MTNESGNKNAETLKMVLARHPFDTCDSFITIIAGGTYFKT